MDNLQKTFDTISDIHIFINDIKDRYFECLNIFPFNVSQEDCEKYKIEIKNVNLVARTTNLLYKMQLYWNFSTNQPGQFYGYDLWIDMMTYGYKCGEPPI